MTKRVSGTRRSAPPSGAMADEVARAASDYSRRLPVKMRTLAVAIARARTGDDEALVVARSLAHRLHGTAGCYGFPEIGALAAMLDEHLGAGEWSEVDRALVELEAATVRLCA